MLRLRACIALVVAAMGFAALAVPNGLQAQSDARRDLADVAEGTYFGDVISDARGSSQSDVQITVAKIAPNRVRISSSYSRLQTFDVSLTRAMDTIQNRDGDEVFLLDLSRDPPALNVTVDEASWAGSKK